MVVRVASLWFRKQKVTHQKYETSQNLQVFYLVSPLDKLGTNRKCFLSFHQLDNKVPFDNFNYYCCPNFYYYYFLNKPHSLSTHVIFVLLWNKKHERLQRIQINTVQMYITFC